jgi:hypothetical protein
MGPATCSIRRSGACGRIWTATGSFNFPRTMMNTAIPGQALGGSGQFSSGVAENASSGYGNYNGGFISFGTRQWHGLTMQHNFTYSKALGTGAVVQASSEYTQNDAYNLGAMYGNQNFDRKLVYNTYIVASEPWFKGSERLLGRAAGGWRSLPSSPPGRDRRSIATRGPMLRAGAPAMARTTTTTSSAFSPHPIRAGIPHISG